jgi:putative transposase
MGNGKPGGAASNTATCLPLPPCCHPRPAPGKIFNADWEEAKRRYHIILPLLARPDRRRSDVAAQAAAYDLHANTLYDWLRRYDASGAISALLPQTRSDKGRTRLGAAVEAIVARVLAEAAAPRMSAQAVCDAVRAHCLGAGLTPPHANTVRNRLRALRERAGKARTAASE